MIQIAARLSLLTVVVFVTACAQLPSGEPGQSDEAAPYAAVAPVISIVEEPVAVAVPPAPAPAVIVKAPPQDLWERVRAGFALPPMDNNLVRNWETHYTAKPEYFARMVERSSHYLFHITEEVERRKMPAEIALLPMIESAYNPQAYSRAHASGLWQFIPSTGKLYGLRQNWWYDGRRDVIAATNAALDYLQKLYAEFGDWELALASYNWGEGAVGRAIARNQAKGLPTDYASLNMPAETRNYLPKLIAVRNIIADPARFDVQLAAIPNAPYFEVITVQRHIDIKLAAQFAGMPLDEFKFLNPAHNKPVIKAEGTETIVLPRDKVEMFNANLENHAEPLVSWQAHTIRSGEKPEKIAAKYGISVSELKQINGINARNKFRTGLPLLVPVKAGATPHLPDLPATPVSLSKAYKTARSKNVKRSNIRSSTNQKSVTAKRAPEKRSKVVIKPAAKESADDSRSTVAANQAR